MDEQSWYHRTSSPTCVQSNEQQVDADAEQESIIPESKNFNREMEPIIPESKNSERGMEKVEETKSGVVESNAKQVQFSARNQSIIPPSKYPGRDMAEVEDIEKSLFELHVRFVCFLKHGISESH
jgi:hypothetical protein